MTLVVGTNTYINEADADAYFLARANSTWAGASTTAKEAGLIRATSYLDAHYAGQWVGAVADSSQALAWPRSGAIDRNGNSIDSADIPDQIEDATCELAVRALGVDDLEADIDAGGQVKRQKVGTLEIEYNDFADPTIKYTFVEKLLIGLIKQTNRLIRS
jgi:hypothetical protein